MSRAAGRLILAIMTLLAIVACTPKPKEHRELPSDAGPSSVSSSDSAAARNANPGNQKQQP